MRTDSIMQTIRRRRLAAAIKLAKLIRNRCPRWMPYAPGQFDTLGDRP